MSRLFSSEKILSSSPFSSFSADASFVGGKRHKNRIKNEFFISSLTDLFQVSTTLHANFFLCRLFVRFFHIARIENEIIEFNEVFSHHGSVHLVLLLSLRLAYVTNLVTVLFFH